MRRNRCVFLLAMALACGGSSSDSGKDAVSKDGIAAPDEGAAGETTAGSETGPGLEVSGEVSAQGVEEARSALERQEAPAVPDADKKALAEGNLGFALDLYKKLVERDGDCFIAPISVSVAMAQAWAGAKGKTADEIAQVMHFTLPEEKFHPAMNALDQELEGRGNEQVQEGEPFKLSIVNALWGQKGYPFEQAYLDLLATNYGAGLNLVDFIANAEAARQAINAWVASETNDRIKNLLGPGSVDESTRLVLTNAIYFKAGWFNKFKKELTAEKDFHRLDGSVVKVKMMEMGTMASLPHFKADDYEAVALPYVGEKVAMLVILPGPGKFESFEKGLDGAKFVEVLSSLKEEYGRVALPRFGMEYKASLAEVFKALGMVEPFSAQADFTGISKTGELSISDVVHQTFVAVDEEGTEAAGATAVVFPGAGPGPQPEPFSMVVDRPFIFAIVDLPTRAVLFLGRMSDPS